VTGEPETAEEMVARVERMAAGELEAGRLIGRDLAALKFVLETRAELLRAARIVRSCGHQLGEPGCSSTLCRAIAKAEGRQLTRSVNPPVFGRTESRRVDEPDAYSTRITLRDLFALAIVAAGFQRAEDVWATADQILSYRGDGQ
jgi:hypothetical protein